MSAARKLLLAMCIVGALIAIAAVVLSDSWSSDSTNMSSANASSPQYPENLVVDGNDESGTVVTARALNAAPGAIVCADYEAVGVVFDL